jgi:hypothetical protein
MPSSGVIHSGATMSVIGQRRPSSTSSSSLS